MLALIDYLRFALTLFGVLSPFAAIPTFLMLTSGRSHHDVNRIAGMAGMAVFTALLVAALSGDLVLRLIGASLPAFQVGGGIVLFLVGLSMINARLSRRTRPLKRRAKPKRERRSAWCPSRYRCWLAPARSARPSSSRSAARAGFMF